MTILRIMTDIEVTESFSDDDIEKVTTLFTQFGNGVVPATHLNPDDKSSYAQGHLHVSNEDFSCRACIAAGKDMRS